MTKQEQYDLLYKSLDNLKSTANGFAIRFINDVPARIKYNNLTKQMSDEILYEVRCGKISPLQGAEKAQTARNMIMEQIRKITSDMGRAEAEKTKLRGKTLSELENKYALEDFKKPFRSLSETENNQVWLKIVKKAGAPNEGFNLKVRKFGRVGRLLIFLTLAVAVYNITTADDKVAAAEREGVSLAGGFLGGAGGGALAGLACGPGAPVCVTIGVFVGGLLGAIGSDMLFESFSNKAEVSRYMNTDISPAFEKYHGY